MIPHLIDGKHIESPHVLENLNPATGMCWPKWHWEARRR